MQIKKRKGAGYRLEDLKQIKFWIGVSSYDVRGKSRPPSVFFFLMCIASQFHSCICILFIAVTAEMSNKRATWLADLKTLSGCLQKSLLAIYRANRILVLGYGAKEQRHAFQCPWTTSDLKQLLVRCWWLKCSADRLCGLQQLYHLPISEQTILQICV